ncbi:MAG: SbcC/MukB-like Walker B domain-containing protein [Clostridium sp.]|uniref:SbcC/MukB-like Walker B domain-containing protein n=2 Tax=Clostridium TaxID=1485 RepID=UPI002A7545C3|nr:AAA family ATPase [Clostridium sp.]MDY2630026.1 SbcC/MukB-like Walker B domain-containing protein [Clostridium sp.]
MKIKKLIVSAFGPYATEQELDFEKYLDNQNMFVITGNTGAGKTTIFDAINFVLYGEASGSERDGKSLRSDFADSSTKTEVKLWFSLKNKDYYIKRSPQYFRSKQRGEGLTENKAEAELIYDDKTITGTKEVTRQVEEILGITCEQFKQLVMIPQGEFKKLLNSDSDKKEEIFRKIFGTKVFSDIQNNIKTEANSLKKSIEEVLRDRENKIKSFQLRKDDDLLNSLILNKDLNIELILEEFVKSIDADKEEDRILKEKEDNIKSKLDNLSKELVLGKEANKKLETLEKYKIDFERLNALKESFKLKEEELRYAKKAVTALNYEEKYIEKKRILDRIRKNLSISIENLNKLKIHLEKAKVDFKKEVEKEPIRNELNKRLDEIQGLKEKTLVYKENSEKLNLLKASYTKIKERIENIKKEIDEKTKLLIEINNEINIIQSLKEEASKLDIESLNYKAKEEKLNTLKLSIDKLINELSKEKKLREDYEVLNNNYINKRKIYEALDESFRNNLAGILAKDLEEGKECPVCGSISHPNLAKLEDKDISEDEVKKAKLEEEASRKKMEVSLTNLTKIKAEINSLKNDNINKLFKEIFNEELEEDISLSFNKVYKELISVEEILNNITLKKKEVDKEILKELNLSKKKSEIENLNEALRKELEEKNNELLLREGEVKTQEANLNNIVNDFKGSIKSIEELNLEEKDISNKLKALKEAYEKSELDLKNIKTEFDKENGNKDTLEKQEKEADTEYNNCVAEFKDKVLSLGFENYKDYISKRKQESEIEVLENEIQKYNVDLSNANKLYSLTLEECKNIKFVDIKSIEASIEEVDKERVYINNLLKEVYLRINQNTKILEDCLSFNKKIETQEEKYKTIGRLSKIINGDNPRKISFERYVLAAYFEDIISAANIRFSKMTNSRFELLRKEEVGDKRKGQGLDLEVYDNYTGKSRDVKTLSGGESFKASLAMALGLSDVVQRYSGGIQLDTIFIDEGFGTLDPESLDIAIETLIDLQDNGRVVGIISHVQELKDRIEVKLEVTSTNQGSKVEFRI